MVGIRTVGNGLPENGTGSGARNPHLASWHFGGRRNGARQKGGSGIEQPVHHLVRLKGSIFRLNIDQQSSRPVEGDRTAMIMTGAVGKILEATTKPAHAVRIH